MQKQTAYTGQVLKLVSPKTALIRATHRFAQVIADLENDLERMRENPKLSQEFLAEKDAQIDQLIEYQHQVENVIGHYETHNRLLTIQNKLVEDMLAHRIKEDETFSSYFFNLFLKK